MEEISKRLDDIEARVMNELESIKKMIQTRILENREPKSTPHEPPAGKATDGYRGHESVLDDPRSSRSSGMTSFLSVGKALRDGIDSYNARVDQEGGTKIPQLKQSAKSFSRDAMSTAEMILGASKVFGPHMGERTLQEIKSLYCERPQQFQEAYFSVAKKLVRCHPVLCLASGGWAANCIIMGKLVNLKNSRKKMQDDDTTYVVPDDYASDRGSTEHSSSSQDSEEWAEVVEETCALHSRGTVCRLCKKRGTPDHNLSDVRAPGKRRKT